MTKSKLERTKWARDFRKNALEYYEQALKHALNPKTKYIVKKEKSSLGGCRPYSYWYVWVLPKKEFIMEAFVSKECATAFCKRKGWRYEIAND